jgi:hypothetical protein
MNTQKEEDGDPKERVGLLGKEKSPSNPVLPVNEDFKYKMIKEHEKISELMDKSALSQETETPEEQSSNRFLLLLILFFLVFIFAIILLKGATVNQDSTNSSEKYKVGHFYSVYRETLHRSSALRVPRTR